MMGFFDKLKLLRMEKLNLQGRALLAPAFYILQVYSFATNTTPTTPGPTWVPMVGPIWPTRPPVR